MNRRREQIHSQTDVGKFKNGGPAEWIECQRNKHEAVDVKRFLLPIGSLLISGCAPEHADTPQAAKGETNIRYVICGEIGCFVAARFKDIDGCERHKQWSEMLCDSRSEPGKMIARRILWLR